MRNSSSGRSGPSSKGKSFKTKDANKAFKKPFNDRPYKEDRLKQNSDTASSGRTPYNREDKPKRSFGNSSEERKPYNREDKPKRDFRNSEDRKPFKKEFGSDRKKDFTNVPKRSFRNSSEERKPYNREDKPKRDFGNSEDRKPFKKEFGSDRKKDFTNVPKRSFRNSSEERKPYNREDKPKRDFGNSEDRKPFKKEFSSDRKLENKERPNRNIDSKIERKPFDKNFDSNARKYAPKSSTTNDGENTSKRRFSKPRPNEENKELTKRVKFDDFEDGKVFSNVGKLQHQPKTKYKKQGPVAKQQTGDGLIRLNKYLSNAGVASRRDADTLIQSGTVKVNGVVVDQLGYKITATDKVTYGDAAVRSERKVYLLLNKPKDYITTVDDPQERKTVMQLIAKACKERVYPVGRLDRNTTGLLLFTNDGDITTKLTHPKFGVKKIYHVSLNKGLKADDFKAITDGLELEDGFVKADDLAFVGEGKKEIGIEIHSGKNRIVRRLFEHLGYEIIKLDRVAFAGLTKKDLPRGKHRFLTAKEIGFLQMVG
jgi:23S rRNA pseudouridine2605 synthase